MNSIKKSGIIRLMAAATTLSFYTGFIISCQPLRNALSHIAENEYLRYKMIRLAALALMGPLWTWLISILLGNLIAIILFTLWKLFFARILDCTLRLRIKNRNLLKTSAIYVTCFLLLIYGEWTINGKWASLRFSILNVLLNIGILLIVFLLGWLLLKTGWEKIFKIIKLKYIEGFTIFMVILLIACCSIVFISAHKGKKPTGPNIILIVVDCLRADHLSSYGYFRETSPHIDKIAREGIIFKKAYGTAPWTRPSVASIFSSLYPNYHGTNYAGDKLPLEIVTLAEALKNNGYHTYFFNGGNPHITGRYNFYQGFDSTLETITQAVAVKNHFQSEMANMQKGRFFAYLHFMDVHLPYQAHKYNFLFTDENKNYLLIPRYIKRDVVRTATFHDALTENDKKYLVGLYDGQINYVDHNINEIISLLKNKNLLENTIIIITSDHGDEFWDHQNFEHGHTLYNELIHVPLIIAGTEINPGEISSEVSQVDLYPTILEFAHIPTTNLNIQGESLFKFIYGTGGGDLEEPGRQLFALGTLYKEKKFCLVKDRMKLIFNAFGKERPLIGYKSSEVYELYDLKNDPAERFNIYQKKPGVFLKLKKILDEFKKVNVKAKHKDVSPGKDKELVKKLKSLGYL